jgi:hypothetical protein
MAIPLQPLKNRPSESRDSMTSETSAILSYALGKHVDHDTSSDSDHPCTSLDEDDETFFKENDPLTAEYETFPQKKVCPWRLNVNERNPASSRYAFIRRWVSRC